MHGQWYKIAITSLCRHKGISQKSFQESGERYNVFCFTEIKNLTCFEL